MADDAVIAAAGVGGWIVYAENEKNASSFEDSLQKYLPTKTTLQDVGWILVQAAGCPKCSRLENYARTGSEYDVKTENLARKLAAELAGKAVANQNNPKVLVINGRGAGWARPTKKILQMPEHETAKNRLRALAIESSLISGRWMLYPKPEDADALWCKIATAIIHKDGALRGKAHSAKVSVNVPEKDENFAAHTICVYVEDSWDLDKVGVVFEILAKKIGFIPGEFKADIYSCAGITQRHASQLRSSLYVKSDFMSKAEMDEIIKRNKSPAGNEVNKKAVIERKIPAKDTRAAPALVRKIARGTGFVDWDSDEEKPEAKKIKC